MVIDLSLADTKTNMPLPIIILIILILIILIIVFISHWTLKLGHKGFCCCVQSYPIVSRGFIVRLSKSNCAGERGVVVFGTTTVS